MKTVYLHMGYHKTGTTSFQRTCELPNNRQELEKQGFFYPLFQDLEGTNMIYENHSIPLFTLFTDHPETYVWNLERNDIASFRNSIQSQLEQVLINHDKIILSGEDLFALGKEGLLRLKQFLQKYVDSIIPIVVIRSPYAYYCSLLAEMIRFGAAPAGFRSMIAETLTLSEVFSKEIFMSYQTARNSQLGLVKFLMTKIGVNTTDINELKSNFSENNKITRLQYVLNCSIPKIKQGKFNPDFIQLSNLQKGELGKEIEELKKNDEPFRLTAQEFRYIKPLVENENEFLRNTFGAEFCDHKFEFSSPLNLDKDLKDYPQLTSLVMANMQQTRNKKGNFFRFFPHRIPSDFSLEGYKKYNPNLLKKFDNDYFLIWHYLQHGSKKNLQYRHKSTLKIFLEGLKGFFKPSQ